MGRVTPPSLERGNLMYKFFGTKETAIKNGLGVIVFRFDSKGEFITDDEGLIKRIKSHFDYIEMESSIIGERVKVATEAPKMTIVNNLEVKSKKCKKCEFTCDSQGELLAHYKTHKEEQYWLQEK